MEAKGEMAQLLEMGDTGTLQRGRVRFTARKKGPWAEFQSGGQWPTWSP